MTIGELVDFIDVNRDSNDEYIEIAGPNKKFLPLMDVLR